MNSSIQKARNYNNWMAKSDAFYNAGIILVSEFKKGQEKLTNSVGSIPKDIPYIGSRIILDNPIAFCFCFSVELLVKAILVKKDPTYWVSEKGKVNFGNHGINKLINDNIPIKFTEKEKILIDRLEDHISWGKYPERNNLSKIEEKNFKIWDIHPYKGWNPDEFEKLICKIREKFMDYISTLKC